VGGYGSGKAEEGDGGALDGPQRLRAHADGGARAGERTGGLWGWTYEGEDRPHAVMGYDADLTEPEHAWLRLYYCVNATAGDHAAELLTSTQPPLRADSVEYDPPSFIKKGSDMQLPQRLEWWAS
jgi:hypothetical protein